MSKMNAGIPEIRRRVSQAKQIRREVGEQIDYENWKKRQGPKNPQLGIKATVLKVYAEKGKLSAWQALQEYNKGFTLEMLEQWIGEYEKKQAQGVWKDDGYGR